MDKYINLLILVTAIAYNHKIVFFFIKVRIISGHYYYRFWESVLNVSMLSLNIGWRRQMELEV